MTEGQGQGLVSVVIPCYNRERFIGPAVDSVLAQTWPKIELIVVDDGSTDSSRAVLEAYGARITLLEHPDRANRGQSAAINLGLKRSRGEYLAILDSDDLFGPDKIEKQVRYLEAHPEIGLVYANCLSIDEDGRELYAMYGPDHRAPSGPAEVLESSWYNVPSSALFRRSVLEQVGCLDESLRAAQDHDFAIRIAEVSPIGYLNECLWRYRRHQGSISFTKTALRWRNGFLILEAARRRHRYPRSAIRRRRAVLHFRLGQCLLSDGSRLRAGGHMLLAALLDPARAFRVAMGREAVSGPQ